MKKIETAKIKELLEALKSKTTKFASMRDEFTALEADLRSALTGMIGGGEDPNKTIAERVTTALRSNPEADIPHYQEYKQLGGECNTIEEEIKALQADLRPLVNAAALVLGDELTESYNAHLELISKTILPFCKGKEEALDMASKFPLAIGIHIRRVNICVGPDVEQDAGKILRELELALPQLPK